MTAAATATDLTSLFHSAPQLEGYAQPGPGLTEVDLIAATAHCWFLDPPRDHRGQAGPSRPGKAAAGGFSWISAAVPAATGAASVPGHVCLNFIAASCLHPHTTYPFPSVSLYLGAQLLLQFNVGEQEAFQVASPLAALRFEPRRNEQPFEMYHRQVAAGGHSGIYRLVLHESLLTAGQGVPLRVELSPTSDEVIAWFAVHPRRDVLSLTIQTLAQELQALQQDLLSLKRAVDRLDRQSSRLPRQDLLESEKTFVVSSARGHYHPPVLAVLPGGEVLLSYREGSDHIGDTGVGVLLRSADGGRTWGQRTVIAANKATDHRIVALTALSDGRILCCNSLDCSYDQDHNYTWRVPTPTSSYRGAPGPLYVRESRDQGRSWQVLSGPLWAGIRSLEVTKPIIELPGGALLMPMYYLPEHLHGSAAAASTMVLTVQRSDDGGKTWRQIYALPSHTPPFEGEPTLCRSPSGRLIMMVRTAPGVFAGPGLEGPIFQIDSEDEGKTWSDPHAVALPSLGCPPHLTPLRDGRIVCTYGRRKEPALVGVCLSYDQGKTWDLDSSAILAEDLVPFDCGYPCTVELGDGTLLTVYYNNLRRRFYVAAHRYRL